MTEEKQLAKVEQTAIDTNAFQPADLADATKLAKALANSRLVPDALQGKPDDVLVVLMTGREVGMSAMQSVNGIHVIKGRTSMSAATKRALVLASPVCEYLIMTAESDEAVTYETKRVGAPAAVSKTFSIADAQKAGIANNPNYNKYRKAMLGARASSMLCDAVYPDIVKGLYSVEEVQDFEDRGTASVSQPRIADDVPAAGTSEAPRSVSATLADAVPEPPRDSSVSEQETNFVPMISKRKQLKLRNYAQKRAVHELGDGATKDEVVKMTAEILLSALTAFGFERRDEVPETHYEAIVQQIKVGSVSVYSDSKEPEEKLSAEEKQEILDS